MNRSLSDSQLELLLALCSRLGAQKLMLVNRLLDQSVSASELDELCELISNEFLMHGIDERFEPNDYGSALELLFDAVNGFR